MSRPTFLTIDLAALQHNLKRVKQIANRSAVLAMVKANGYGHGIKRIAPALFEADALGVASLEEGIQLREAGITQPIVLLEGLFSFDEIYEAANHHFSLVVHHLPHVEMLETVKPIKPFMVWLKINTGMHRLGISPQDFKMIWMRLQKNPAIQHPIGLMSHFACADDMTNPFTSQQINLFANLTDSLPGPRSLVNSAGILAWQHVHYEWVRPGLMLYGASPFPHKTGLAHGLQPVMTLSSRIIAISRVKKGDVVGYGATWQAEQDGLIGIVGVGYGDGYPQFAKNGTPVLVNGVRCPIAGRVSMDMLTVDLAKQPHAQVGDPVILWGRGLPVEEIAHHSHTSPYEILTRMTPRPKIEVQPPFNADLTEKTVMSSQIA